MTDYVGVIIQGVLNGIGNGLGVYFLTKHILSKIDGGKGKEKEEEKKML